MKGSWTAAGAPAVPAALALSGGILLAAVLPCPPPAPAQIALALLSMVALTRRGRLRAAGALVLCALAGGLLARARFLAPAETSERTALSLGEEVPVEVVGRIARPWTASGSLRLTHLTVQSASANGRPVALPGPLALHVAGERDPAAVADRGDLVRVRGPLRLPEPGPSARSPFSFPREPRLALKSAGQLEVVGAPTGLFAPALRLHRALRSRLQERFAGAAPEDRRALALLLAVLMGDTADVPPETVTAFRDGGTAHLLAISGLQVGLVAMLVRAAARRSRLSVRTADLVTLAATLAFAAFAGFGAPVLRAALMITAYLLARLAGRPTSPAQVFGLSALLLLALDPGGLFDVGFLLTFGAVFGLSQLGAPLARALERRLPAWVATPVAATLGAELAVLPVQAFVFNTVPLVGLVSNLLVVPLSAAFLVLGGALLPLLVAPQPLATAAFAPLRVLADLHLVILSALDRLHAVRVVPTPPFWLAALLAAGVVAVGLTLRPVLRRAALALCAALTLALLLSRPRLPAPGTALVQALDVGQGDGWLLSTSGGALLVDGGGSFDPEYEFGRKRLLPKLADLGAVALDTVVLTHPHPDHGRGLLGILPILPVGRLVIPRNATRNQLLDELLAAAGRRDVPVIRLGAGERLPAAGLTLDALHPGGFTYPRSRENNGSLVLRAALPGRTLLLTGDVEAMAERDLLASGATLRADVLKVPHHGSRTSTTPSFLSAVAPRVALIGVGRRNRFGHPAGEVLARLAAARARVFRTDRDGDFALRFEAGRILPDFALLAPSWP